MFPKKRIGFEYLTLRKILFEALYLIHIILSLDTNGRMGSTGTMVLDIHSHPIPATTSPMIISHRFQNTFVKKMYYPLFKQTKICTKGHDSHY